MHRTPCHVRLVRISFLGTTFGHFCFGHFWRTCEKTLPVQYPTPVPQFFVPMPNDITVRTDNCVTLHQPVPYRSITLRNYYSATSYDSVPHRNIMARNARFTTHINPLRIVILRRGITVAGRGKIRGSYALV